MWLKLKLREIFEWSVLVYVHFFMYSTKRYLNISQASPSLLCGSSPSGLGLIW